MGGVLGSDSRQLNLVTLPSFFISSGNLLMDDTSVRIETHSTQQGPHGVLRCPVFLLIVRTVDVVVMGMETVRHPGTFANIRSCSKPWLRLS